MTTYTPIADSSIDIDSPVSTSLMTALRNNPIAISEGASGAPRVQPSAIASPYFQATRTTNQTLASTGTYKVQFSTEEFDPDGLYDAATNYRFTPNKAGIYLVGVSLWGTSPSGGTSKIGCEVKKNGTTSYATGAATTVASATAFYVEHTCLVSMNGSTDYLEGNVFQNDIVNSWTVQGRFWAIALCKV